MKPLDVGKLSADPLLEARSRAGVDTVTVRGFVRRVDGETIALASDPGSDSFVEYPRAAVVAAFGKEESTETTLVVEADSQVRVVSMARSRGASGAGCGTECQSADGTSKCCCAVGQRCVSWSNGCRCEEASVAPGAGDIGSQPVAMAMMPAGGGLGARGGRPGWVTCCCGSGSSRRCTTQWCESAYDAMCACSASGPSITCGRGAGLWGGSGSVIA